MNTNDLLSKVKLKGALPEGRFEDEEILEMAYDALLSELIPLIVNMREEYLVKSETSTIAASIPIPTRALGMALREVKLVRSGRLIDLPRINLEYADRTEPGTPEFFYLENNSVVPYPAPASTSDSIKQSFYFRPNRLVLPEACATITAIDWNTGEITATVPSTWVLGDTFDLVSSSQGHDVVGWDLAATSVTPTGVTLDPEDLPSTLKLGDTISLAGESPFAQIPDEAFNLLAHMTICDCLEEMGALTELKAAEGKVERLKSSLSSILSNRVQGAPKKFRSPLL